jgi:hypothetical protein
MEEYNRLHQAHKEVEGLGRTGESITEPEEEFVLVGWETDENGNRTNRVYEFVE